MERNIEFYSTIKRPKKVFEYNSGEVIVERAGYIPTKVRIEEFMAAGIRLENYKKMKYDFRPGEKIDENFYDPTRRKSFDMAEATILHHKTQDRLREAYNASESEFEKDDQLPSDKNKTPQGASIEVEEDKN